MANLEALALDILKQTARLNDNEVDFSATGRIDLPTLDQRSEDARNQLVSTLRTLESLVLGPKDTMQNQYYRSAETGVIQALCQLKVPQNIPQDGSISYSNLAQKINLDEDRLKHLARNAIVCSGFLTETSNGELAHSPTSSIWYLDPLMAGGMEVMLDHLPEASFNLGNVCVKDTTDTDEALCGFSNARSKPLYQYLEHNPAEGKKFGGYMRAQASTHGDQAIKDGYDWSQLAGKTIVDCGGSFGSVCTAIVQSEPTVKCIVQDLPKVVENASDIVSKNPNFPKDNISFQAHSFFEPQPTTADVYLFRQVFLNHSDTRARTIFRSLKGALKPGAKVIVIEYVQPEIGTAPIYADVAHRRLDNTMYALMKGKVRELSEFKRVASEAIPELKFTGFKQGQYRATHDPRCHCVMEWTYEPEVNASNGVEVSIPEAVQDTPEVENGIVESSSPNAVQAVPEVENTVPLTKQADASVAEVRPDEVKV